jgi:hypothetical protein
MPESKIIITGTGRAGTTFLVHLLTALGEDTGFDINNIESHVHSESNGGLETCDYNRKVLKSPFFWKKMPEVAAKNGIDHVFIPIRSLEASAKSRIHQGNNPGGVWGANDLESQMCHNSKVVYQIIYDCTWLSIPFTVIDFNRMMSSHSYLRKKLRPFRKYSAKNFERNYNNILDKQKIRF